MEAAACAKPATEYTYARGRAGRYAGFWPRSARLPSQGKCNEIKWLGKNVAALIGIAGPRFWEIGSSHTERTRTGMQPDAQSGAGGRANPGTSESVFRRERRSQAGHVHESCYVHEIVNKRESVNTSSKGLSLERALLDSVRRLFADIDWLHTESSASLLRAPGDHGADAVVQIGTAGKSRARIYVHAKSDVRPGAFPAWARQRLPPPSKEPAVSVLATPFVSPRLADLCRQEGWGWIDLAGNCRIDLPGLLRIERAGIPPFHVRPTRGANLGTTAAARVVRVLLSPGHAGRVWRQRDLQTNTCWQLRGDRPVSLGLVNKVVRHLRDEGFVEGLDDRSGIRVRDPRGLLAAWSEAYRFDRHERRSYFTLLKGTALREALYRLGVEAGNMAAYAAFSAAERQAPHVRQPKTWLYVDAQFLEMFARNAEAKEVDSGENVVVLIPNDSGVFLSFEADSHVGEHVLGCTDPVQTYVDLIHAGGRGEEAAEALAAQKILPAWKAVARP